MIGLIGKKIGMTQIFDANGMVTPVTVIKAGPCRIICKRTIEKDGYEALQIGYEEIADKRTTQPLRGHFKKHNSPNYRHVSEFRPAFGHETSDFKEGDELKADFFSADEYVCISGTSKGRGFTGVVKRHGFAGFEQTHGVHESFRGGGSIGQCAQPSRVLKGVKMAGQHGNKRSTVKHLKVVKVDAEQGLIMVKGAVPGHRNALIYIKKEQ